MATDRAGEMATCGCGTHGWIVERTHHLEVVDPRFWIEHEGVDELCENRVTTKMENGSRRFVMEVV